jgi:hypothetical protein
MVESRKEIRQRELRERGEQLAEKLKTKAVFGLMDSDRGDGSARHAISLFPATSDFLSVTVNRHKIHVSIFNAIYIFQRRLFLGT